MEKVKSTLRAGSQTHHEVQGKQTGHENLPVPSYFGKLVAQGRDYCFRPAKLKNKKENINLLFQSLK